MVGNHTDVVETLMPVEGDPPGPTLVRSMHWEYDDLYRLTREHVIEDDGSGSDPVTTLDVRYFYDKVGNRQVMVRDERTDDCIFSHATTYAYDDNDRLTGSTTVTEAVNLAAQNKLDRYYASRPRPWTRWFALSFVGLTLAAFRAPLLIPARKQSRNQSRARKEAEGGNAPPKLGHRARRKRLLTACVATFLVPLMAVDLRSVDAAFTEALQVQAALTAGVPLNCPTDTVSMTYGYDDNGNQVSRTRVDAQGAATDTYTFDYQNRLAGAITNIDTAPTLVDYTYDADGIRTSKTINKSAGTFYLTDKNQPYAQVVEERDATTHTTLSVRYTYGDDLISQYRLDGAVTRYYHYDGQMSTRQLTDDASGAAVAITDRYAYDAFGLDLTDVTNPTTVYRYTGEQYDDAIGDYYLRARYYSPATGRFVGRDSYSGHGEEPITLHKYLYANSNPVNMIDPGGHLGAYIQQLAVVAIWGILTAAIGGVVGGIVGGVRGAILGAIAGAALGIGFATKNLFDVVKAGLWQGTLTLLVEYFISGIDSLLGYESNLSAKAAFEVFFAGFAYGSFSAAITLGFDLDPESAVGAAALAFALSAVTDVIDAYSQGDKLNFSKILINALIAFALAIVANPTILYGLRKSGHSVGQLDKAVKRAAEENAGEKLVSWFYSSLTGFSASSLFKSFEKNVFHDSE